MNNSSRLFDQILYSSFLIGAMLATFGLIESGINSFGAMVVVLFFVNILIYWTESKSTLHQKWVPSLKLCSLELKHLLTNSLIVKPIVKVLLVFLTLKIAPQAPLELDHYPLWLKIPAFIVLSDFFIYWGHRWMHRSENGWKIHVVHHTPYKMFFLAAIRSHPFNVILTLTLETVPLFLLGASDNELALWTVYMGTNGLLQHSNIDFKMGWLNKWLATNQSHQVHHRPNWEDSNSNFGNTTMIWDRLFGTFRYPLETTQEVGLSLFSIPDNYWQHLKTPFQLEAFRIRRSNSHTALKRDSLESPATRTRHENVDRDRETPPPVL